MTSPRSCSHCWIVWLPDCCIVLIGYLTLHVFNLFDVLNAEFGPKEKSTSVQLWGVADSDHHQSFWPAHCLGCPNMLPSAWFVVYTPVILQGTLDLQGVLIAWVRYDFPINSYIGLSRVDSGVSGHHANSTCILPRFRCLVSALSHGAQLPSSYRTAFPPRSPL